MKEVIVNGEFGTIVWKVSPEVTEAIIRNFGGAESEEKYKEIDKKLELILPKLVRAYFRLLWVAFAAQEGMVMINNIQSHLEQALEDCIAIQITSHKKI